VERQLVADGAADRMAAEERKQVATKAVERQRNRAAKAGEDEARAAFDEVIGAAQIADGIEVPPVPRLLADDITPEAAASLLAEQGGRLAIISAEGGIFDIIAGRYSPKAVPNMDLWLKGHSGDPLRVDRKGRPPEHIPRPALTLGLMIQPSVLDAIILSRMLNGQETHHRPPSPGPGGRGPPSYGLLACLSRVGTNNTNSKYARLPLNPSYCIRPPRFGGCFVR
jgi:uncharacterized protein DUF3987